MFTIDLGIKYSPSKVFSKFLDKIKLDKSIIMFTSPIDGNTLLHKICKNSDVGIEVLQKVLFRIQEFAEIEDNFI